METYSIDDWMIILGRQDATHSSAEIAAANRIIGDLVGYQRSSRHRQRDAKELANAMQAYARMCIDAGLRP